MLSNVLATWITECGAWPESGWPAGLSLALEWIFSFLGLKFNYILPWYLIPLALGKHISQP